MAERKHLPFQRRSDCLPQQRSFNTPYTAEIATESTPLLKNSLPISSQASATRITDPSATSHKRPTLNRAATAAVMTTTSPSVDIAPTPVLPRPISNAAPTIADAGIASTEDQAKRPSLLRRATDVVVTSFTIASRATHKEAEQPNPPTFWADHIHRQPLLRVWDNIPYRDASNTSLAEQLTRVEHGMLRQFGELGSGEVALTSEWIEHILGLCLRPPFCTGRWQRLATAAGPRGNWGPW